MNNKYIILLETHIEKLVLVIVSLVCLWLLVTRVFISPNKVEFGSNKEKLAPADVDQIIKDQAVRLDDKLGRPSNPASLHEPNAPKLKDKISLTIADVNTGVYAYLPASIRPGRIDDRQYKLPDVSPVQEVTVEHIRSVVYEPIEKISVNNTYSSQLSAPNDLDMVTVAGEIDISDIYNNFYDCFSGVDVPDEWKDPCLAQPIFGAVELQRQEYLADGIWSQWQVVPRARTEARQEMFKVLDDSEALPTGGIKMNLYKFNDRIVTADLLQPEPYRIASEEEQWYPPLLHERFSSIQRKQEVDERKSKLEEEKNKRDPRRSDVLQGRGRGGTMSRGGEGDSVGRSRLRGRGSRRGPGGFGGEGEERGMKNDRLRSTSRKKKKKTEMDELDEEFLELLITEETDLSQLEEPLTFWSHDDTVEPGKKYKYRLRLGVFNPVAGTSQVKPVDRSRQNQVILWSKYSEVTEPIEIPKRLYFFPLRGEASENKTVTMKILKYKMGYWYGWQGAVRQGEIIGKEVDNRDLEEKSKSKIQSYSKSNITLPETIDYSTGSVLVDVMTVDSWVGTKNLTHKYYSDMLYSYDGGSIDHMPIQQLCWPREIQLKYQELEKFEKREKKPFRAWAGGMGRFSDRKLRKRRYGGEEEEGFDEDDEEGYSEETFGGER